MNDVIVIGPVGISLIPLGFILAASTGYWTARRLVRDKGGRIERRLTWAFLAFLISARAWHVVQYWPAYASHPLSMLAVMDGGWNIRAGVAISFAGVLFAFAMNAARWRELTLAAAAAAIVVLSFDRWLVLRSVPEFSLPTLSLQGSAGRPPAVLPAKGQWQVINLWATWCPSCLMEIPDFLQARTDFPDVRFWFVDEGENGARVDRLLGGKAWDASLFVLDPGTQLQQRLQTDIIPVTLFVDGNGTVREVHRGMMSASQLRQALLRLRGVDA